MEQVNTILGIIVTPFHRRTFLVTITVTKVEQLHMQKRDASIIIEKVDKNPRPYKTLYENHSENVKNTQLVIKKKRVSQKRFHGESWVNQIYILCKFSKQDTRNQEVQNDKNGFSKSHLQVSLRRFGKAIWRKH